MATWDGYRNLPIGRQRTKEGEAKNRNLNRNLQTSKAPLQSQAQGTSLFTSDATNQRGYPKSTNYHGTVTTTFRSRSIGYAGSKSYKDGG